MADREGILAAHAVSTEQMWALDIEAHLWGLGYELFRDEGGMQATFNLADFQKTSVEEDSRFAALRAQVDLVLLSHFLHLFDGEVKIAATKKIVSLAKPDAMIAGFQQGRKRAPAYSRPLGMTFYHNQGTFVDFWRVVQEQMQTRWTTDVSVVILQDWGMQDEDLEWMPEDRMGINSVITRES